MLEETLFQQQLELQREIVSVKGWIKQCPSESGNARQCYENLKLVQRRVKQLLQVVNKNARDLMELHGEMVEEMAQMADVMTDVRTTDSLKSTPVHSPVHSGRSSPALSPSATPVLMRTVRASSSCSNGTAPSAVSQSNRPISPKLPSRTSNAPIQQQSSKQQEFTHRKSSSVDVRPLLTDGDSASASKRQSQTVAPSQHMSIDVESLFMPPNLDDILSTTCHTDRHASIDLDTFLQRQGEKKSNIGGTFGRDQILAMFDNHCNQKNRNSLSNMSTGQPSSLDDFF